MNRTILKLVMIVTMLFLFKNPALGRLSVSKIADTYSPSVVTIITLEENHRPLSVGSGFFINTKGDLATNHHLFTGSVKALIKTLSGRQGEITEIIHDDPKLDLLIAKTTLRNTIPIPLGDSNEIIVGEDVVVFGNPQGLEGSISLGKIHDVRTADGVDIIQITAPILPGCSGGPVLTLNGEVIGISTAFLDLGEDFNFAMPVNYLKTIKPTRLKISSLSGFKNQLEVTIREGAVVELLDIHYNNNRSQSPYSNEYSNKSDANYIHRTGTVHFKDGKRLVCEKAWRYEDKIFLVVRGKKVAISYDQNEIDMRKSFDLSNDR